MQALYQPSGAAREYSEWACNIYRGCQHGCQYCYAPACLKMDRSEFHSAALPRPGILEALTLDCQKLRGKIEDRVLLCFTSDPYQPIESQYRFARQAIRRIKEAGLNFQVLTKGGTRAAEDFALYQDGDAFATTLTFIEDQQSLQWEPGAALPSDRIAAIKTAHESGITTWASLEPVIDPAQSLEIIKRTADIVDQFRVGKWNHDARAKSIDWYDFGTRAIELLKSLDKDFYIKHDLRRAMGI